MSTTPLTPNIQPPDGTNAAPPGGNGGQTPVAPSPQQPPSRLGAILGAVAKTVSTGLAGIPNQGRPSFVTGLGEGARSAKQAEATQQAIRFKTTDDQIRMASLHNQDLKMQNDTQEEQDAHQKAELDLRAFANEHGIKYDTIANHGQTVMDHLANQTSTNGAASVPPGTHISADGKTIQIPQQNEASQQGFTDMYKQMAPALQLPVLPPGQDFATPKNINMMHDAMLGKNPRTGENYKHDELPGALGSLQAQRDNMVKNGASDSQLKALDNAIGYQKAQLSALDSHTASVKQKDIDMQTAGAVQKKQAELDIENSPKNQAAAARGAAAKTAAEQEAKNASGGSLMVGTDKDGNQVAGTADELTKVGASGVTKLSSDTGTKVITARQLISPEGLFSQIRKDMDALDAKGKLGSAATARFNEALLSKAGSDPDFAPLLTHTHLLATALMQAHVGSKGSENMMEEFKNLANAGKMSSSTLRSALGAEYNYVHEKAMLPKKAAQ